MIQEHFQFQNEFDQSEACKDKIFRFILTVRLFQFQFNDFSFIEYCLRLAFRNFAYCNYIFILLKLFFFCFHHKRNVVRNSGTFFFILSHYCLLSVHTYYVNLFNMKFLYLLQISAVFSMYVLYTHINYTYLIFYFVCIC